MKKISLFTIAIFCFSFTYAQSKEGRENINKLCGCFTIEFKYAETFSPNPDYKYHKREVLGATELALPIEQSDKKVVIQHLLVMGDSSVIKHWREDWVYEQPFLWKFVGDKKWVKQNLKPEQYKGKWTQTIWEVDDAPRYGGISEWVTTDGKTFWQSTADAPLPRREYTTRNDYNILRRGNRLTLKNDGYVHEQDNDKIVKGEGKENLLAQEKGYNTYWNAKEGDCAYAKQWWERSAAFWKIVREQWASFFATQNTIQLQSKVDGKRLNQYFDELATKWEKKELPMESVGTEVKAVLQKFIQPATGASTVKIK